MVLANICLVLNTEQSDLTFSGSLYFHPYLRIHKLITVWFYSFTVLHACFSTVRILPQLASVPIFDCFSQVRTMLVHVAGFNIRSLFRCTSARQVYGVSDGRPFDSFRVMLWAPVLR